VESTKPDLGACAILSAIFAIPCLWVAVAIYHNGARGGDTDSYTPGVAVIGYVALAFGVLLVLSALGCYLHLRKKRVVNRNADPS